MKLPGNPSETCPPPPAPGRQPLAGTSVSPGGAGSGLAGLGRGLPQPGQPHFKGRPGSSTGGDQGWTLHTIAPLLLGPRAGVACFPICSSGPQYPHTPQLPPRTSVVKLQRPPLPMAPSARNLLSSTRLNSLPAPQPREVKSRQGAARGSTCGHSAPVPSPGGALRVTASAHTRSRPQSWRPGASGSDLSPWAPDRAPSALSAFPQHRPLKLPPPRSRWGVPCRRHQALQRRAEAKTQRRALLWQDMASGGAGALPAPSSHLHTPPVCVSPSPRNRICRTPH